MQSLAAANINNVRIGGRDRDGADRLRRLVIEDGIPGSAVVVGLPDPAIHLRHVKNIGLAGHPAESARAAAAEWADHPPVQFLVSVLGDLRPTRGCGQENEN